MQAHAKLLGLALAAVLFAPPVTAEEAHDNVWHLFKDDAFATLVVVDRAEVEAEEPYWPFAISCSVDEPWQITIAITDARKLGELIADGGAVEVSFVVNGEKGADGLGGYFPTLRFGEMFGEWEASIPVDLDMLEALAAAKTLGVAGSGVDMTLPDDGMREAFAGFRSTCEQFAAIGEGQPSDDETMEENGTGEESGEGGEGGNQP